MKHIASLLVLAGLGIFVLSPSSVFAAEDVCGRPPLPACSGGNPLLQTQVWGLTGEFSVVVPRGATITDEYGFSVACTLGPCTDLTRTDYYRNQMRTLARSILSSGQESRFPMFAGWFNSVR